jgi:hypothetical protein
MDVQLVSRDVVVIPDSVQEVRSVEQIPDRATEVRSEIERWVSQLEGCFQTVAESVTAFQDFVSTLDRPPYDAQFTPFDDRVAPDF